MRSPAVRLDSFDPERGGRSFRFHDPVRTLRTDELAEIRGLVREIEERLDISIPVEKLDDARTFEKLCAGIMLLDS